MYDSADEITPKQHYLGSIVVLLKIIAKRRHEKRQAARLICERPKSPERIDRTRAWTQRYVLTGGRPG